MYIPAINNNPNEINARNARSDYEYDCDRIKNFIEENRFPVIKKLDTKYLNKLVKTDKTLILAVIISTEVSHIKFLKDSFYNLAIKYRKFVFSYINVKEDSSLLEFFKLDLSKVPQVLSYDFSQGNFNVNILNHYDNYSIQMENHMDSLIKDNVVFSTGYLLEDALIKLGFKKNRRVILSIIGISIIFCFFFFLLYCLFGCSELCNRKKIKITKKTLLKDIKDKAKLTATVVLPVPPFPLATDIINFPLSSCYYYRPIPKCEPTSGPIVCLYSPFLNFSMASFILPVAPEYIFMDAADKTLNALGPTFPVINASTFISEMFCAA